MQVLAAVSSIAAVTTRQPVVAVLYLVLLFSSVSILMVLIGQGFIGLSYLIVYVGAIAMLFVFVVMLLNVKSVDNSLSNTRSQLYSAVVALAITAGLAQLALTEAFTVAYQHQESLNTVMYEPAPVPLSSSYLPASDQRIVQLAQLMFSPTELSLLVMVMGLLLLITMVACLTLCLRHH